MPICADDYSIEKGVSRRILNLLEDGFICSTSVMVVFDEIDFSAELSQLHKKKNIGLHFTLTDFSPVSPSFSKLLNGRFPSFRELVYQNKYRSQAFLNGVELELDAQIKRFVDILGFVPDHIDCHHHLQFMPVFQSMLSNKTKNVRTTRTKFHLKADSLMMTMRKIVLNRLTRKTNDSLFLLDDKSNFNQAVSYFEKTIKHYDSTDQLIFHPGDINEQIRKRDTLVWQRQRDFSLLSDRNLHERYFRRFLNFKI